MTTKDTQRVSGIRTEVFYITIVIVICLVNAFFVGMAYQSTTAIIAESSNQTDLALGVLTMHAATRTNQIENIMLVDIVSASSTSTSDHKKIKYTEPGG